MAVRAAFFSSVVSLLTSNFAAFAALSTHFLWYAGAALWTEKGDFSFADQVELVRMYSSEIEYSEENMDAVFNALAACSDRP